MAKGKPSAPAALRQRKNHGPKRHLFKEFKPMIQQMSSSGILNKYHNYESFELACIAKGKRSVSKQEFIAFQLLKKEDKVNYFKNLSNK